MNITTVIKDIFNHNIEKFDKSDMENLIRSKKDIIKFLDYVENYYIYQIERKEFKSDVYKIINKKRKTYREDAIDILNRKGYNIDTLIKKNLVYIKLKPYGELKNDSELSDIINDIVYDKELKPSLEDIGEKNEN